MREIVRAGREARGTGISSSNCRGGMAASAWSSRKMSSRNAEPKSDAANDANLRIGEGVPEGKIYLTGQRNLAGVMMGMNGRGSDAYLVGRSLIHLGR